MPWWRRMRDHVFGRKSGGQRVFACDENGSVGRSGDGEKEADQRKGREWGGGEHAYGRRDEAGLIQGQRRRRRQARAQTECREATSRCKRSTEERLLVELKPHLLERDRVKVVHVDPTFEQRRLGMLRHELTDQVGPARQLFAREVEERGHVLAGRHLGVRRLELVKEGVTHRLDRGQAGGRGVLEQLGDQVDRLGRSARAEHLDKGMRLSRRRRVSVTV